MQYDETIQNEIENLLRQKIGLNPESVGSRSILRAVKKGMRMGKMQGLSDYLTSLQDSPERFESLIESVVVPETSFFRNRASFVFLRQWISQSWPRTRPLRVLSLPCSTGEEPYSIVITLLEEGLSLDEFHIDAVDISVRALEKAKQGIYSPYAFRRQTYRSDDKYFHLGVPEGVSHGKRVTQRYYLVESVREKVAFHQGNVLDETLLNGQPPYDIVFCRNLLIYFDREARDRTLTKLDQLLRPGGLLFLGYAEAGLVNSEYYQAVPYPQTFAYYKQSQAAQNQTVQKQAVVANFQAEAPLAQPANNPQKAALNIDVKRTNINPSDIQTLDPERAQATAVEIRPVHNEDTKTAASKRSLLLAQKLADRGDIRQAIEQCDRYLVHHPADAEAYLLRGELYQADGDEAAAVTCFEKAVYLEPKQSVALTHLLFWKESQGDLAGAAVIRERLQRIV
ncbi:MAG: CheR family methyltransferase [Cyanobacteria bacterium J06623_4]